VKGILSRDNREVLEQFACSSVLLAFDFDGTLAPIVADREHAAMRATTRACLAELSRLYPIVVISGRSQADVLRRLNGTSIRDVIGNHGIEPWRATARLKEEVRRWLPVLHDRLSALRGVKIEDKGFSVAIHYRQSRKKRHACAAIHEAALQLGDIRVIGGKQVVNFLPLGAPHKGLALERERRRHRCDTAIYVGDDETDEDVFGLEQPGRLLAIRVGAKRSSQAAYFIRNQRDIDELLRLLAAMRPAAAKHRIGSRP
jgi:trehalose 6-phosphate phosphatase